MNIREFSFNLQKIYEEMSEAFSSYQKSTGLHCLPGCGRCCLNPEIEASPLEMIPLALKIYDQGKLEEWLELLENPKQEHCILFKEDGSPGQGSCDHYQDRPSICRMFGVSGYFDKHQKAVLSICKYIREENQKTLQDLERNSPPMLAHWSYKLSQLDPKLIQEKRPINMAIKDALECIALSAQYHNL